MDHSFAILQSAFFIVFSFVDRITVAIGVSAVLPEHALAPK
jgi:hypothetical protein